MHIWMSALSILYSVPDDSYISKFVLGICWLPSLYCFLCALFLYCDKIVPGISNGKGDAEALWCVATAGEAACFATSFSLVKSCVRLGWFLICYFVSWQGIFADSHCLFDVTARVVFLGLFVIFVLMFTLFLVAVSLGVWSHGTDIAIVYAQLLRKFSFSVVPKILKE